MTIYELSAGMSAGKFDDQLKLLYGVPEKNILRNRARYLSAAENFSRLFPECGEIKVFSVGGMLEICGGIFPRQLGKSLGIALDADIIAIAAVNDSDEINVVSEGFGGFTLSASEPGKGEGGNAEKILSEMIRIFKERSVDISGFDVYFSSEIPAGRGMTSSAALEVCFGMILNNIFAAELTDNEIVRISCEVENKLPGKKDSMAKQAVCALGGAVLADLTEDSFEKISFDPGNWGYSVCVVNTGCNDFAKNDELVGLTAKEMNVDALGKADEEDFFDKIAALRDKCRNEAILQAFVFFDETRRSAEAAEALENGDTELFFELINGTSGFYGDLCRKETALAVMLSKRFLRGSGAVKVNSRGDVITFVPGYLAAGYVEEMEAFFGDGSCRAFNGRYVGGYELK